MRAVVATQRLASAVSRGACSRNLLARPAARSMCAVTASNDATRIPTEDRPEYAFLKAQDEALREHEEKAKAFATPWNIVCATFIERIPLLMPDMPDWEMDYIEVQNERAERYSKPVPPKPFFPEDIEERGRSIPLEELHIHGDMLELMRTYEPKPRSSKADETNDVKSLERKMQDSLYLIVKRRRTAFPWQFPQMARKEGESMRACAERSARAKRLGPMNLHFLGNAPQAFHFYPYSERVQEKRGVYGAKVYYFRAQVVTDGDKLSIADKSMSDHAWVTASEMGQYFDEATYNAVKYMF